MLNDTANTKDADDDLIKNGPRESNAILGHSKVELFRARSRRSHSLQILALTLEDQNRFFAKILAAFIFPRRPLI